VAGRELKRTRRSHCGSRPGVWGRRDVRIDAMVCDFGVFARVGRVGGSWGVSKFLGMRWGVRLK
jgi:hypothetical protein